MSLPRSTARKGRRARLSHNSGFRSCSFQPSNSLSLAWLSAVWGCSSVGRAVALQAIGREFESPQLHQPKAVSLVGPVAQLVRACA
jgi:hypothetical protein